MNSNLTLPRTREYYEHCFKEQYLERLKNETNIRARIFLTNTLNGFKNQMLTSETLTNKNQTP